MKNKKRSTIRLGWLLTMEILLGILLLGGVFIIATKVDMRATEEHLSSTIGYIKEQYNQHKRLNLASESKSVMRVMQSAHQIEKDLDAQEKSSDIDESMLQECAQNYYVTGILVLDTKGNIQVQYCKDELDVNVLSEYIESKALQDTAQYSEKSYGLRYSCEDNSYIDLAAVGRTDHTGIILAYYHTPTEYVQAFSNSVESLLSGYSLERDGTIVISSGKEIVASNNEKLIGKSTDDIAILRKIRERATSNCLVHERRSAGAISQDFGIMEHGRDYYVYAYMPESDVFSTTFQNVLYSLIIYIIIIAIIHTLRWKMTQTYQEQQLLIQKEYTEKLQNKNEQLREAVNQADLANAAKTNFLSRMSHDIRTPLNGIIGLLEIDERHPDDLTLIQENQKKMKISANHLLSLINDVLQMSKLESGEVVFSKEPIHLADMSKEVLTIVENRAAEAGITLEYDKTVERIPYSNVYGSPLHLRQVFLNIYSNCIKYNKVGGKVETSCVCVGIDNEIVTYQWTIQDTGIGMSKEFLAHIFEPFAQEQIDARSVYNGTGLGMSIVKNLIEQMNGTIEVSSELGVGSTFVITLPFEIAKEQPKEERQNKHRTDIHDLHVLLVEDNELNAEIAQTLLEDRGFSVEVARDGKQAVQQYEQNPIGTYDAILMDVMMPVMDGITATKMIREMRREDAKTIPIIAMTANAFDEDVRQCIEAGMNAHIPKPLQPDQMIETLIKYC